jgi:hypothetical protein
MVLFIPDPGAKLLYYVTLLGNCDVRLWGKSDCFAILYFLYALYIFEKENGECNILLVNKNLLSLKWRQYFNICPNDVYIYMRGIAKTLIGIETKSVFQNT